MTSVDSKKLDQKIDGLLEEALDFEDKLQDMFIDHVETEFVDGELEWRADPEYFDHRVKFRHDYEEWYAQSYELINEYLGPKKQKSFEEKYDDMMTQVGLEGSPEYPSNVAIYYQMRDCITTQSSILNSIKSKIEIREFKLTRQISDDIVWEELQTATRLYNDKDIRAAGVVAGVALERELKTRCEAADIEYSHDATIKTYAEFLYDEDEITNTKKSQFLHLSDIRNKCSHANEEDPTDDEVDRLLNQTKQFVSSTEE